MPLATTRAPTQHLTASTVAAQRAVPETAAWRTRAQAERARRHASEILGACLNAPHPIAPTPLAESAFDDKGQRTRLSAATRFQRNHARRQLARTRHLHARSAIFENVHLLRSIKRTRRHRVNAIVSGAHAPCDTAESGGSGGSGGCGFCEVPGYCDGASESAWAARGTDKVCSGTTPFRSARTLDSVKRRAAARAPASCRQISKSVRRWRRRCAARRARARLALYRQAAARSTCEGNGQAAAEVHRYLGGGRQRRRESRVGQEGWDGILRDTGARTQKEQ
eukprot:6187407-Pleurochrysis_carterae.AAC.1